MCQSLQCERNLTPNEHAISALHLVKRQADALTPYYYNGKKTHLLRSLVSSYSQL